MKIIQLFSYYKLINKLLIMATMSSKKKKLTRKEYENMTIEDLEYLLILRGQSNASVGDKIRNLNRQWNEKLTTGSCQSCRYNKHVELAHLKGVAEFDKKTLLKEVNDEHNILVLCRNCHWEYDNGLLSIVDIDIRRVNIT